MKDEKGISPEELGRVAQEADDRLRAYLKREKENPEKAGLWPPEKGKYEHLRALLRLPDSPAVYNFLRLFVMLEEQYSARLRHNSQGPEYIYPTEERRRKIESSSGTINEESNALDQNIGRLIRKAQSGETNIAVDTVPEQLRGALKEVLNELSAK